MTKIAALTSGPYTPSTRFRIRQHITPLKEYGFEIDEFFPNVRKEAFFDFFPQKIGLRNFPPVWPLYFAHEARKTASLLPGILASRHAEITWLERGLCPGWPTFEFALKRPLVLDVDDAVWKSGPFGNKQMRITAQRADVVCVGNSFLADWFGHFNSNIRIIPTSIDSERFFPAENKQNSEDFIVGWTGTSGNFRYLYNISEALNKLFQHVPTARLLIVAECRPDALDLPNDRVDFQYWSEENESKLIQVMDVGIMPLNDDEWCKGKCAFKMLQYMACGLPVVVSPVGMNLEVMKLGDVGFAVNTVGEWADALIALYENPVQRRLMGSLGRTIFENYFSRKIVTKALAEIFRELVAN